MDVHAIDFELVRPGPAHNQLLSPLTEYIALCGDHEPHALRFPFEHEDYLLRLETMRYVSGDQWSYDAAVNDVAKNLAATLGTVPSLVSSLSESSARGAGLTHLRLKFSASELALLPFEIMRTPPGVAGTGDFLALQNAGKIVITREQRSTPNRSFGWPWPPRILCAIAGPRGSSIPTDLALSHIQALRQALSPFTYAFDDSDHRRRALSPFIDAFDGSDHRRDRQQMEYENLKEKLTVLPNASLRAIRAECTKTAYSHVHILAHGGRITKNEGRSGSRFGLVLHHDQSKDDPVTIDGQALVASLCRDHEGPGPAVVSLASCDSGQQGDVLASGASVGHALHRAGVPLVVASQFPLTMLGSTIFVKTLYQGLLGGEDPRLLLYRLRQDLASANTARHDWASLVAYANFPVDLERDLSVLRHAAANHAMRVAIIQARASLLEPEVFRTQDELDQALADLKKAQKRLPLSDRSKEEALQAAVVNKIESIGALATAEKRRAEIFWHRRCLLYKKNPWLCDKHEGKAASGRPADAPKGKKGHDSQAASEPDKEASKSEEQARKTSIEDQVKDLNEKEQRALYAAMEAYRRGYLLFPGSHWMGLGLFTLSRHLHDKKEIDVDLAHSLRWTLEAARRNEPVDRPLRKWAEVEYFRLKFHVFRSEALPADASDETDLWPNYNAQYFYDEAIRLRRDLGLHAKQINALKRALHHHIDWLEISAAHSEVAKKLCNEPKYFGEVDLGPLAEANSLAD